MKEAGIETAGDLRQLLKLGGFPEPFFGGSEVEARRWSHDYRNLLIREEIVSLERVQDLGTLELLALRLPELVGSPLSINLGFHIVPGPRDCFLPAQRLG